MQFDAVAADGNGSAVLSAVSFPRYLSMDLEGGGGASVASSGPRIMFRMDAIGSNAVAVTNLISAPFIIAIVGDGFADVILTVEERAAIELEMIAIGVADITVPWLLVPLPPVQVVGTGDATATFAPYLPPIAEPAWNELRGTINLVRNASVEQTDVGLLDWSGVNGATLALDDTVSWHGLRSVEVTYPNTGSDARVTVRSEHGLGITGDLNTAMVGSLWALGEITFVQARLTATYSDATTDTATGDLFDLAAVDDWVRVVTPSLTLDPAKTLDYLTLDLMHPTPDAVTVIHVDGAQIEQDRGEGATPFAQGDMGDAYAWLGPAGLSMSLRETMAVTT